MQKGKISGEGKVLLREVEKARGPFNGREVRAQRKCSFAAARGGGTKRGRLQREPV